LALNHKHIITSLFLISYFCLDRNNRKNQRKIIMAIYPLTLLYDGACPVCNLEMDNLKTRNAAGLLSFVDISAPGFDDSPYGASIAEMNALIHAQRADGGLVIGVEVFRLAYGAVGLGRWAAPTGGPVLKPLFDAAYAVFARHRYFFSRYATPLIRWIANRRIEANARRALLASQACKGGSCELPSTVTERSSS
jgi:predicted DCC family thiol-disulfide oxidoreductase YuxK